jgi:hypothetical protein
MAILGVAHLLGLPTLTVFYPFGHPILYTYHDLPYRGVEGRPLSLHPHTLPPPPPVAHGCHGGHERYGGQGRHGGQEHHGAKDVMGAKDLTGTKDVTGVKDVTKAKNVMGAKDVMGTKDVMRAKDVMGIMDVTGPRMSRDQGRHGGQGRQTDG